MILYGKDVAEKLSQEIINEVEILKTKGINPKLAIVRVGRNESDLSYERGAVKKGRKARHINRGI